MDYSEYLRTRDPFDDVVGVIPVRYQSSRFPGKPLALILGKPMVLWVAEKVAQVIGKHRTYVATDDERIKEVVESAGFQVVMTSSDCLTGTDRVCEFAKQVDSRIYLNVQGDEPLVDPKDILKVIESKRKNLYMVAHAMCKLRPDEDPYDLNIPKVITNRYGELIYASRAPIPHTKSGDLSGITFYKQVCIYAFNGHELGHYYCHPKKTYCEQYEDIEILRFIDLGYMVKMVEVDKAPVAVDLPEHIPIVEKLLLEQQEQQQK